MKLKESGVAFYEKSHTYYLNGKELSGITSLIHSVLGLGVYPDADDFTRDFIIPKAGSLGTAVHHAIRMLDETGIYENIQYVETRQGNRTVQMEWDVTNQLESYIFYRDSDFESIANEFTVTDGKRYASQIDNVWRRKSTGGIWLGDTKTNNTSLYPLCGYFQPQYFLSGEEALKDYLSWQLSIYAELFERQTGIKVEGLFCNWLRDDESDFWIIERKPSELVWELLSAEWVEGEFGIKLYYHHDVSVFGIGKSIPKKVEEKVPIIPTDVVEYMTGLLKTCREAEEKLNEAKAALRMAMTEHNVNKYDFGTFTASLGKSGLTRRLDTARLKKDFPDLYDQYCKEMKTNGSLTIKLKDNG